MSRIWNVGVIGCGSLAQLQHLPNIVANPRMNLHTCCDLSPQALEVCQTQFGAGRVTSDWRQTIADPEVQVLCIATTEKLRLPLVEACAQAGKPFYVEKPIAATLEDAFKIERIVRDARLPACVGHNRRSAPAMVQAHQLFRAHMTHPQPIAWRWKRDPNVAQLDKQDGVAGMSVRINDDWYSWKTWVFDKTQAPFGPMLFEMTHFTDLCNWFMGSEPVKVTALETGMFNHGIVIAYAGGEVATILMNASGTFGYPKELYEMFGHGAAVVVDHMLEIRTVGIPFAPHHQTYPMLGDNCPHIGAEGGLSGWLAKRRWGAQQAVLTNDPSCIFTAEPDKGHARQFDRFLDELEGHGPVVCPMDQALLATRVSFAAIRSAREERAIELAEVVA